MSNEEFRRLAEILAQQAQSNDQNNRLADSLDRIDLTLQNLSRRGDLPGFRNGDAIDAQIQEDESLAGGGYLSRERSRVLEEATVNPRRWFRHKFMQIANSRGANNRVEFAEMQAVVNDRSVISDHEAAAFAGLQELNTMAQAKSGTDDPKGWVRAADGTNFDHTYHLMQLQVPIFVEKDVTALDQQEVQKGPNTLAKISIPGAIDILESNPLLFSKLLSHDTEVSGKGEEEWADLLCQKYYGFHPDKVNQNFKFYLPKIPDGYDKEQIKNMSPQELAQKHDAAGNIIFSNATHIPPENNGQIEYDDTYYPFKSPEYKTDRYGKRIQEGDYKHMPYVANSVVVIDTPEKARKAFSGIMWAAMNYYKASGRVSAVQDRASAGRVNYQDRKAYTANQFFGISYEVGLTYFIPFCETGYRDLTSAEIKKFVHQVDFLDKAKSSKNELERSVLENGLESKSERELMKMIGYSRWERRALKREHRGHLKEFLVSEATNLRADYLTFIYQSNSINPTLMPYLDLVAKRKKVVIPGNIRLRGFEGRYKKASRRTKDFGLIETEVAHSNPVASTVDFSDYKQSMRFLIHNKTRTTVLRDRAQMQEIAAGMAERSSDLFSGMDFTPLIAQMRKKDLANYLNGNYRVLSPRVQHVMRQLQQNRQPVVGADAIKTLAEHYSTADWNLKNTQYDMWSKHAGYTASANAAAGMRMFRTPLVMNISGFTRNGVLGSRANAPDEQVAKMNEMLVEDIKAPAHYGQEDINERAIQIIDMMALMSRKHGFKNKLRVIKVDKSPDGSTWSPIKVDARNQRPELGFTPQTIIKTEDDGSTQKSTVLLGPGLDVVVEGEDKYNINPIEEGYGGRAMGFSQIKEVVLSIIDGGGGYSTPLNDHLKYHILAALEDGSYKYDINRTASEIAAIKNKIGDYFG